MLAAPKDRLDALLFGPMALYFIIAIIGYRINHFSRDFMKIYE